MFAGTILDRAGPFCYTKVLGRKIPFINSGVTFGSHRLAVLLIAVGLVENRFVVGWGSKLVAAATKRLFIVGLVPVECDDVFPVVRVVNGDMPVETSGGEGIEVGKDERSHSDVVAIRSDGAKLTDSESNVNDLRFTSLHLGGGSSGAQRLCIAGDSRSIGPSLFAQIPITVMQERYVEQINVPLVGLEIVALAKDLGDEYMFLGVN
jgi:hypothetical protein